MGKVSSVRDSVIRSIFGPEAETWSGPDGSPWNGMFVKTQLQLAFDTSKATGRKLTAVEALDAYGRSALAEVADKGCFVLPAGMREPADTLRGRRELLGLTVQEVARAAGLPPGAVIEAEAIGHLNPVRNIERIAQTLGLDERFVGMRNDRGGDEGLGAKLRMLRNTSAARRLSPSAVLRLAEAAWVVARQASLVNLPGLESFRGGGPTVERDAGYSHPAWRDGYRLAERTRELFQLDPIEPITSVRALLDERQGIPLLPQEMPAHVAGATLSNGGLRGIVVNIQGRNENVWVRRMTIAHELCHFLWDPEDRLGKLRVDSYDDLECDFVNGAQDHVEQRANAFAVEFLAPRVGIRGLAEVAPDRAVALSSIMDRYGISATSAGHHLDNSSFVPHWTGDGEWPTAQPSEAWRAAENFTIDYFPVAGTPIVRRGQFALLVAKAHELELISSDTGAMLLGTSQTSFDHNVASVLGLAPGDDAPSTGPMR